MTNLNQIAKELEQKAKQRDKKSILEALKEIPDFYPSLVQHSNLQFLKDEYSKLEAKVKDWKWPSLTDKLFSKESFIKRAEGKPIPKYRTIEDDIYAFVDLLRSFAKVGSETTTSPTMQNDDSYIPFTKAVDYLSGCLTKKQLRLAIKKGVVRSKKPSKQRLNVHIQDIDSLKDKLKVSEDAKEEATRMFGTWKEEAQRKIDNKRDLS